MSDDASPDLEWMKLAMVSQPEPVWHGDLDDDCTARWCGLTLRAEWMDDGIWWWAVNWDDRNMQIASSNDLEAVFPTGEKAREAAEKAALSFIKPS